MEEITPTAKDVTGTEKVTSNSNSATDVHSSEPGQVTTDAVMEDKLVNKENDKSDLNLSSGGAGNDKPEESNKKNGNDSNSTIPDDDVVQEGANKSNNAEASFGKGHMAGVDRSGVQDDDNVTRGTDDKTEETEDTEVIDVSKEPALEDDARILMFEEGLKLDKEGKKLEALRCYLKCLVGLKENSRFALLPQCLRNVGDIYYGRNEYDKAVSFIQAEKLYYESVLIDDTELQKHIDEVTAKGAEGTEASIDALRATEYEQLAKLCMDEKQPQLALEYAGKCTKLRQKVYGDGHPLVQQSLDYFATVYAEVGKVQYTESMSKYDTAGKPNGSSDSVGDMTPGSPTEPTSILRRRKTTEGDKEKKVRFDESTLAAQDYLDREEKCARVILLVLFFLLLFVLLVLGIYIFCSLQPSSSCRNFRHVIMDTVMRIKYWYYHLWSGTDTKYT